MASHRRPSGLRGVRRAASIAALVVVLVCVLGAFATPVRAAGGAASVAAAAAQEHSPESAKPAGAEGTSHEAAHEEPLWKTGARFFNFAILVGVLVYFLRAPIADYLARRSTEIRSGLTKAEETRQAAAQELTRIEQRMAALPQEIEALKTRGAEEIAAEEARIRKAAETERERLLEQARREIDLQVRTAERDLVRHAADLAVGLATDRIKRNITDADQQRLVDRYLAHVRQQG